MQLSKETIYIYIHLLYREFNIYITTRHLPKLSQAATLIVFLDEGLGYRHTGFNDYGIESSTIGPIK